MPMKYSIAIMAGGQSRRFGSDKTLSYLNNKLLIEYILESCKDITNDLFIVSKEIDKFSNLRGCNVYLDSYKQQCPLVGIITALNYSKNPICMILPADSPFYNSQILQILIDNMTNEYDIVVPVIDNKMYPLTSIYRINIKEKLTTYFLNGEFKLFKILKNFKVKYLDESFFISVDPDLYSFTNINSQEDLKNAEKIIAKLNNSYVK